MHGMVWYGRDVAYRGLLNALVAMMSIRRKEVRYMSEMTRMVRYGMVLCCAISCRGGGGYEPYTISMTPSGRTDACGARSLMSKSTPTPTTFRGVRISCPI